MTPEWRTRAHCADPAADPNLFIDSLHGEEPSDRDARHQEAAGWCDRCPVAEACLAHGIAHGETGVWGGWMLSAHVHGYRRSPRRILLSAEKRRADRERRARRNAS